MKAEDELRKAVRRLFAGRIHKLQGKVELEIAKGTEKHKTAIVPYEPTVDKIVSYITKHYISRQELEEAIPPFRTDETDPIDDWLEKHPQVSPNLPHEARLQVAASRMFGYNEAITDLRANLLKKGE